MEPGAFFFLKAPATTQIYTLSLHDALPIWSIEGFAAHRAPDPVIHTATQPSDRPDRKSTRLNSSHGSISYAVLRLKKKKNAFVHIACRRLLAGWRWSEQCLLLRSNRNRLTR